VEDVHDLVVRAAAGDSAAWSDLVARFGGMIWSIARSVGLNESDAADVSQTTWLRFSEHLDRLHDSSRAGAWLATTARREAIRVSRLGTRQLLVDPWNWLDQPTENEADLDSALLARERDILIQHAVGLLSERCRRLLMAAVADTSMSYEELSASLGMPIGSIGPTRGRCLKHLGRLVEELEHENVNDAAASAAVGAWRGSE
jgi:RNA polymerase sigma factor (sigma-70 family)